MHTMSAPTLSATTAMACDQTLEVSIILRIYLSTLADFLHLTSTERAGFVPQMCSDYFRSRKQRLTLVPVKLDFAFIEKQTFRKVCLSIYASSFTQPTWSMVV
jgi:hypothetical protein